jgi:hypothetical protein
MVNLLSRGAHPEPFPALDTEAWVSLLDRLQRCIALGRAGQRAAFQGQAEAFESELEELEIGPGLANVASTIEAVDAIRQALLAASEEEAAPVEPDSARDGSLILYRPGRSLGTGEAEIASRGYFDACDRPPLWSWLSAVGRRVGSDGKEIEVGILAWVPPEDEARAMRGCLASATQAVMPIELASEAIAAQWRGRAEATQGVR